MILTTEFSDKWEYLTKKLTDPYEHFNSIDDYQQPVNNLQKEDVLRKLENKCPSDKEIEKTKQIIKI